MKKSAFLSRRSQAKELIDAPAIEPSLLRQTYRQLKSINQWTLGYWPTMSAVHYFCSRMGRARPIRILDIGCGDGEILRRIAIYGQGKKYPLALTGIDLNAGCIEEARELSRGSDIQFIAGDILAWDNAPSFDVIINSLTAHHMSDAQIITLMQWMTGHAKTGWSISDLHRDSTAYYFAKFFSHGMRYNHLICHDAPLSVARGFRRQEWKGLLAQAELNLDFVKISWYPNFRYELRYTKPL